MEISTEIQNEQGNKLSRRFSFPISLGGRTHAVWYEASSESVSDGADTLLTTALVPFMKIGAPLRIEKPVSKRLLSAADSIQDILHSWYPADLHKVDIQADAQERKETDDSRGIGLFFSGGIDSFYSLLERSEEITTLIYVHGFDIRLEDTALSTRTIQMVREVASAFGKSVLVVRTNLRSFSDLYTDWGFHYHGAALASVAHLLSPQLKKVFIASTNPYSCLAPWGSHPLLDPQWSSEIMEIQLDGCEATRIQKTIQIASHPVVQKSLRVCWENRNGAYNCGLCEKCLRTMANLRAVGALDQCRTFARPLDLGRLRRVPIHSERLRECVNGTFQYLKEAGKDPELAAALRDCLDGLYEKGIRGWPRRAFQKTQRWVLN